MTDSIRSRVKRHLKAIMASGTAAGVLSVGSAIASEPLQPRGDPPAPPPRDRRPHVCDPLPPPIDCTHTDVGRLPAVLSASARWLSDTTVVLRVSTGSRARYEFNVIRVEGARLVPTDRPVPGGLSVNLVPERNKGSLTVDYAITCAGMIRDVSVRVTLDGFIQVNKMLEVQLTPGAVRPIGERPLPPSDPPPPPPFGDPVPPPPIDRARPTDPRLEEILRARASWSANGKKIVLKLSAGTRVKGCEYQVTGAKGGFIDGDPKPAPSVELTLEPESKVRVVTLEVTALCSGVAQNLALQVRVGRPAAGESLPVDLLRR